MRAGRPRSGRKESPHIQYSTIAGEAQNMQRKETIPCRERKAREETANRSRAIPAQEQPAAPMTWRSPAEAPFHLAGFPWFEKDRVYRRLPVLPAGTLPAGVDNLANNTAGGQIRFRSDTRRLDLRVTLDGPADMNHMPATGQCGFDLYVGGGGAPRYYSTAKYDLVKQATAYEVSLFQHADRKLRAFTLNFPLYQGVKDVAVGLDAEASVRPPAPYAASGRIVIYGTSITQGGCAARPGMAYTNILSSTT